MKAKIFILLALIASLCLAASFEGQVKLSFEAQGPGSISVTWNGKTQTKDVVGTEPTKVVFVLKANDGVNSFEVTTS